MNNSPLNGSAPLPAPIVDALTQLIRRTRRLIFIRGLCASCAAGIGAFLLIMFLDATVTLLSPWPRLLMSVLAYSTWVGATLWLWVRPLTRTFTLTGVARLIEIHHPELQERISSAVQLLSSQDLPSVRGSDTLIAALTEEAIHEVGTIQPKQEISYRGAVPYVIAAGVVVLVLLLLCLGWPRQTGFLLARAAAPFMNLPNVQAFDLVVEPGDALIAAGSALKVSLRTANPTVTAARLLQRDPNNHETVTDMMALPAETNQPGRRFIITLPSVQNGFRYRVHAGHALSRYFTVRVAIPPVITHLDIGYRYPDYSRLATKQERDGSGTIRALVGTTVTLSAQVNKPARQAVLLISTSSSTNTFTGILRTVGNEFYYDFSLILPKGLSGGWTLKLSDEINLTNTPFEHPIQSLPDNPPVIKVVSPLQRELHLNRDARLPITYLAEDDHGLTAAVIIFTVQGMSNELVRSLPMPTFPAESGAPTTLKADTLIVMNDPLFKNAPRFSFRIRAFDNLPGTLNGPQSSDSATFTLIFDTQAASWTEQVLTSQDQLLQQGLKQVQQKLNSAQEQARALEKPLFQQPTLTDSTTRQIDSLQDTLAAADNALQKIAQDSDKGFFEALSSNLIELAESHVGKAENMAGQIRLVDTPSERVTINSNITEEIVHSLATLNRAIQDHETARTAVRRAVELDQLAEKQAALAQARQDAEKAPPIPPSDMAAVAQAAATAKELQLAQEKVATDLAKVARETPGSAAQVATALSNLTAQAATQATALAARQVELAALTKGEAERLQKTDNQWRELASRQNQLADRARNEPLAASQQESMRDSVRNMEADNKTQALQIQAGVSDALRDFSEKLRQSANAQQDKTQEAVRQAKEAGALAEQAAQNANQSLEQARQVAQQAEQQVTVAKQTTEQSHKMAEQAAQQVEQAKGNPFEFDINRAAKEAYQKALAAQRAEDEAREAAQQAKQATQTVEQKTQTTEQAARAAHEAALQAALQAQTAASAPSPREVEQAKAEVAKAAATATAKALDATTAALEASKLTAELRHQTDAVKLAELSRQENELKHDTAQNEALRNSNALKEAELNRQQSEQRRNVDKNEAAQNTARDLDASTTPKSNELAIKAEVRQAQEASVIAQKAAQNASQSVEQARQATQQAEQQATAAAQAAKKSSQTAEQAAQLAEQAKGKANEQALNRVAEMARQDELAAQQTKTESQEAAGAAKQATQAAEQQAQKTQRSAQAAQEAAQQATEKVEKAVTATTPRAAEQAQAELAEATASATAHAIDATKTALKASKLAAEARHQTDAAKLAELARHQVELRREAAQNEALRKNASDLNSDKKISDAKDSLKPSASSPKTDTQLAAEGAQEANKTAQQAAQNAEQAAKKASQAAERANQANQQTEQQVSAAKQNAEKSKQVAEQTAQQAKGKANEQELNRTAEMARQKALAAQQIEAESREAAQQAKQATQAATQQAQKAQQAAQDSKHAAQQAAEEAKKASSASSSLAIKQAQSETSKAAATATLNALTAAEASLEASKSAAQARQQADALKVSELNRQLAEQRREIDKNEVLQNTAQELDSLKKKPIYVQKSSDGKPDPAHELVARAANLKADQQATGNPKPDDPTSKAATQQAAHQAQEASSLAQEAAQNAGQSAEQTKQAAQQVDQQANAAKQTVQKNTRVAEQAEQQAQQARGKANEQELTRAADIARQNALAASHHEAMASDAALQAKQSVQASLQFAQKAQEAARATQLASHRTAEQAQKAASATSKHAREQAQAETAKAAASATTKAQAAAEDALEASEISARTRQQSDALKLDELARQQDELHREGAGLITQKQAAEITLRSALMQQMTEQQNELAEKTDSLARELNKEPPPTRPATQATRAAETTRQAANDLQRGDLPNARTSALEASQAMKQLASSLRDATQLTTPNRLDKRADLARLAQQAQDLSKQQEQMGTMMSDLSANRPLNALQAQQNLLSDDVKELAQEAHEVRAQANDVLAPSQVGTQAGQADQEMAQADQSSEQAAKKLQGMAAKENETDRKPSSQEQQQAAGQAQQNQQSAAQSLQKAASKFQQVTTTAGAYQAAPPASDRPTSASPAAQEAIAQAYQTARQAAEDSQIATAAQSASDLAQAAQEAATDAQSKGANARPTTLQAASLTGVGGNDESPANEGAPSFTRRMGLKLQDWLRLHGEVKNDALQAANTEGPEEYRPIIQRYFHEVSGHGEQE